MPPLLDRAAAGGSRAVFGCVDGLCGPSLSILIFHRVPAVPDPLFPEEIDAARFDRLMRLVSVSFRTMTLGQALAHLRRRSLPPRSIVVSFDDGYADNAEVALPILTRYGIAATFFVSTGFLNGGRMWNDTVIEAIRRTKLETIDFGEYGLGRRILASAAERRAAIRDLLPQFRYLNIIEREREVLRLAQLVRCTPLPDDLMMRSDQVRTLQRAGMELGAHTVQHPILTALPAEEARMQIVGGRDDLAEILDAPVEVMAYPNGRPGQDYNAEHVAMVREAGFRGAVTTAPGAARFGDDPFQLPRFTPWDRSLPAWATRLFLNRWRRPVGCALPSAAQSRRATGDDEAGAGDGAGHDRSR